MSIILNDQLIGILIFFLAVNLLAFFIMLFDKIKARNNEGERISEGMMFFWAALFGSLGIYAGMFVCRHKTRKWYFLIGIPLLILQNAALLYLLYIVFKK